MNAEIEEMSRSDVTFPVKRTEGDTMEEKMTKNAYESILPARYLRKDQDGNLVESPEEVFKRVGRNVALAEVVYHDTDVQVNQSALKEYMSESYEEDVTEMLFSDTDTVLLTEENIKYFGYEGVLNQCPADVATRLQETAEWFTQKMEDLGFMPNSPTIMNAGDDLQQLSACFVDTPRDDMDDIHETIKEAAKTFQSGGGLGYSFSDLRPYRDTISTTGGGSSGPISFMNTFDTMCETIAQGGKRRGAQMGVMRVDHPDIPYFIHAKNKDVSLAQTLRLNDPDDYTHSSFGEALEEARELIEDGKVEKHLRNAAEGHLSNFNISATITDEFMEAVDNDEEYTLMNPRTGEPHISNEGTKELWSWFDMGEYVTVGEELSVPAREIWEDIIDGAYENGEPGVIYIDRVNADHSFDTTEHEEYRIESTNPCLTGDSEVILADGTTATMEELSSLDDPTDVSVLSRTEEGELTSSQLTDAFLTRQDAQVYDVQTDSGTLRTTADHEFRTEGGEWVEAQELNDGSDPHHVVSYTDGEVSSSEVTSVSEAGTADVFDLSVEQTRNFFSSANAQEGAALNVHNCGEQPLMQYEACNLGHINLSTLVDKEATTNLTSWRAGTETNFETLEEEVSSFLDDALDTEELADRIEMGTRFLENVVTMSDFPTEDFERVVSNNRKVGLGIMGLAQMYLQLGVEYGSEVGDEVARQVMERINHGSKDVSHEIAQERGVFANWEDSKYASPTEYPEWFQRQTGEDPEEWEDGYSMRNHNTTTIAPTGTTSMLGNTTNGCEPMFNVAYYKNVSEDVQGDEMLVEFDDYFLRILEANDIDIPTVKQEAVELMEENQFDGVSSLSTVPDAIGDVIVTTSDLSGTEHASVQTACQHGVDSAISKTCNFPHDATREDMEEAYWHVYRNGGKGVTVYRDGTRSKQVLTTRSDNQESLDEEDAVEKVSEMLEQGEITREDLGLDVSPVDRGQSLSGTTQRVETPAGKMYVVVNENANNELLEVFTTIGKSGSYTESLVEAISRLISLNLRSGVSERDVISELENIRGPEVQWDNGDKVLSIPDGIATGMKRHIEDETQQPANTENSPQLSDDTGRQQDADQETMRPECPDCNGMNIVYTEGCKKCEDCGWSAC